MTPDSCPAPRADLLTEQQRDILLPILTRMEQVKFDQQTLHDEVEQMVDAMTKACQSDDDMMRIIAWLDRCVRWTRLPGYWFTYLLQLVTLKKNTWYHILASALYSDAQIHRNDDFALSSLEVAYNSFIQRKNLLDEKVARAMEDFLIPRLRICHAFYKTWCKPFSYMDCNPLSQHLYGEKTHAELLSRFPRPPGESSIDHLLSIIQKCDTPDYIYYRIQARRFLGSEYQGRNQLDAALEQFNLAAKEAEEYKLETETGHIRRLYGHALMQARRFDEASIQLKNAYLHEAYLITKPTHEGVLHYFSYWEALSLRQLGDALLFAMGKESVIQPEKLMECMNAYRAGRRRFEEHLVQCPLPVARAAEQQMFRSFADNALNVAMLLQSNADIISEIEANGPREATEVVAEVLAAQDLSGASIAEFRDAREVFDRHLNTVPENFNDYLTSLPEEYKARYSFMQMRNSPAMGKEFSKYFSDGVAKDILGLHLPAVSLLLFNVGQKISLVVVIDLESGEVIWRQARFTESDLVKLHNEYQKTLADVSSLPDSSASLYTRRALDRLLSGYEELLEPVLTQLLPHLKSRHVKIFPRLSMNAVPLHAMRINGRRLIEQCDVSYGQTLGLFLRGHARPEQSNSSLAMIYDDVGAPYFEGTLKSLGEAFDGRLKVMHRPSYDELLTTLGTSHLSNLFFACHGEFKPNTPAASYLNFGDSHVVSFSDIFARMNLRDVRSVIMGACESGLARAEIGSEYIGLPAALLSAGVRYVLGSLWKVNQLATAILFSTYFELLEDGKMTVPSALNEAQRRLIVMTKQEVLTWMRTNLPMYTKILEPAVEGSTEQEPFAHPEYWAGFYATGDV